jgi:peptide deformylase
MIGIPDPVVVLMDGHPLLRTVSAPLLPEYFGCEVGRLLDVMANVMARHPQRPVGLAAVQIGVPSRVMLVQVGPGKFRPFINPELKRTLNRFETKSEGCLSVPIFKWGDVSRPAKCDATWLDPQGREHSETLTSHVARIFQHELDHLNGILMTDRRAPQ